MTIDGTISKLMEEAKNRKKYAEKHTVTKEFLYNIDCMEQLAYWLEELKDYRDKNKLVVLIDCKNIEEMQLKIKEVYEDGYNKAIDDLIMFSKLHRKYANNTKDDCINFNDFIKFAEQLKAGEKNER